MQEVNEIWLEEMNKEFRSKQIPPGQRPWLALHEWSRNLKKDIQLNSPEAKLVFDWFRKNTKPGSPMVEPYFKGVFYFDASFWEISIDVIYGTVKVDPFASLERMPDNLKSELQSDVIKREEYLRVWKDYVDYAYGDDEIDKTLFDSKFFHDMFRSARRELNATVSLMLERNPNPKAVERAVMAIEMFLKAYLIFKAKYDENKIRSFSHNLVIALEECNKFAGGNDFDLLKPLIIKCPGMNVRYEGVNFRPNEIWEYYIMAQSIATTVVRHLINRDSRKNFEITNGFVEFRMSVECQSTKE